MSPLADSLDALYSAFSDIPKPTKIEGCPCPCCPDKGELRALLSKPLRELTGADLASYSESAFLTVGEEADYLYFLPRILEIACVEAGRWSPDIEITGRAIGETRPSGWPQPRKVALSNVLHAVVQAAIDDDDHWRLDEWICAIARMRLDVAPFLRQIESSTSAVLALYERNSQALMKSKLANAFWEKDLPGFHAVIEWFKSPEVSRIIADGYGLAQDNSPR